MNGFSDQLGAVWTRSAIRRVFVVIFSLVLVPLAGSLLAQESAPAPTGAFHSFTDKQGRNLKARVVSVASNRKTMVIADESGQTFPLEITKLSLDDQQHLKEWIATQPLLSNFRLQVDIEKTSAKTPERKKSGDYRMVTEYPAYRIKVTNLSRDSLENAVVEYFLVKRERVRIYTSKETGRLTHSISDRNNPLEKISEIKPLESLGYNRDAELATNPIEVDRVYEEGNQPQVEDVLLGLVVQVRDDFGNVIGEYRSADPGIKAVNWNDLKTKAQEGLADMKSKPLAFQKKPSTGRQELNSWPESFAKGDHIRPEKIPTMTEKAIRLSAVVEIDEGAEGTIIALGGKKKGFSLFVADGDLQFLLNRSDVEKGTVSSRVRTAVSSLASGEVKVEAYFDGEVMKLAVNGEQRTEGPSVGFLLSRPFEGLSVGFDSGTQTVGPKEAPFPFTGAIREVKVQIED